MGEHERGSSPTEPVTVEVEVVEDRRGGAQRVEGAEAVVDETGKRQLAAADCAPGVGLGFEHDDIPPRVGEDVGAGQAVRARSDHHGVGQVSHSTSSVARAQWVTAPARTSASRFRRRSVSALRTPVRRSRTGFHSFSHGSPRGRSSIVTQVPELSATRVNVTVAWMKGKAVPTSRDAGEARPPGPRSCPWSREDRTRPCGGTRSRARATTCRSCAHACSRRPTFRTRAGRTGCRRSPLAMH